ncbi:hypothetical protein BSL78_13302 [Apostichopus japonicus]|uniref:Uncharacterized protein n=1 Tax=Stichopus japonicus TaxID=307972 RepID=A0A2G8KPB8_STIJA|nr:hypothetical protein BSL78_13302 [Apostichopus japonicus]
MTRLVGRNGKVGRNGSWAKWLLGEVSCFRFVQSAFKMLKFLELIVMVLPLASHFAQQPFRPTAISPNQPGHFAQPRWSFCPTSMVSSPNRVGHFAQPCWSFRPTVLVISPKWLLGEVSCFRASRPNLDTFWCDFPHSKTNLLFYGSSEPRSSIKNILSQTISPMLIYWRSGNGVIVFPNYTRKALNCVFCQANGVIKMVNHLTSPNCQDVVV